MTQDMTADVTESGYPEPGPDTFDFEAWLDNKSTFPVFKHTAYIDQRSGAELARADEEIEALIAEQDDLDKRIEARGQQAVNSFVDAALDNMLADREELDERLKTLLARRDILRKKILETALGLHFQVKTPEELGSVTREAQRQFHKANPQFKSAKEDDLDYITSRTRFSLAAQIAHFCTGMEINGREVPPPTHQGAEKLIRSLISSEMMRLMEAIATGLSASQEWAEKIDAGFPGGGPDVEDVSLDSYGPQGGEVVAAAPDHDADREALRMD